MKQNPVKINLRDFTNSDHPFGNIQGREVYRKLVEFIDKHATQSIFGISLQEIKATDASFPRESVISIAKQYCGEKGFYLEGIKDRDLIDNWNYAAAAKKQPLVIWNDDDYELIGPEVSSSIRTLLDYIFKNQEVTAARVSNDLDMSVQNASTKLKKLATQGFVMRCEESAESGGVEYIYRSIK